MDTKSLRSSLLARIHRQYQTVTQPVRIGSIELQFTRIANPDTVLDQVVAECDRLEKTTGNRESDPQHLPYWAELWESAAGLGQFLEKQQAHTHDHPANTPIGQPFIPAPPVSVLDLGCGMGLSGTLAAALGHRVMFADLEAPALLFAQLNSLPFSDRVRCRRVNWQKDRLEEQFDLILGADILYERKQWEFLESFWNLHLTPGGLILLGEPGRPTGDDFIKWIVYQGWTLDQHEEPVPTRPRPIRILCVRHT